MDTSKIKLKYSKIIPLPGYYAVTIFNCIYRNVRYKNIPISHRVINHELIHFEQARDFVFGCEKLYILGYILFYICYFIEWLFKALIALVTLFKVRPYRSLSFEQEAYTNEKDFEYLDNRKRFSWLKYLFKLVKK